MEEITCPYRSVDGQQPVCQIVADIANRPLAECHVNDGACRMCLKTTIPPQAPNSVIASMVVGVGRRSGDKTLERDLFQRMKAHLTHVPPPVAACVLRGTETRKVDCKPCQANSLVPVRMPVYRCPKHGECTLHNTGTFPRIQACATCADRLEQYVQLDAKPIPADVAAAISRRLSTR